MLNALDRMLDGEQLDVVFQPIFDISSDVPQPYAFEALTRGPAGSNFQSAPVLFDYIRLKKEEPRADRFCVEHAIAQSVAIPSPMRVSINVHGSTLERDTDFAHFALTVARRYGLAPERLIFEIVEQMEYCEPARLRRGVDALRSAGCAIALDDVGCGHCNLQMAIEVAPEYLKLDRYFVAGCATDAARRAVVRAVLALSAEINAVLVAEGLESAEDLAMVRSLGVHLGQGFGLAVPQRAASAVAALGWSSIPKEIFHAFQEDPARR